MQLQNPIPPIQKESKVSNFPTKEKKKTPHSPFHFTFLSHLPNMPFPFSFLISLLISFCLSLSLSSHSELSTLMALKASLDPQNKFLTSWTPYSDPCNGSFGGVACNEQGKVVNISLQGKGLSGSIPPSISGLKSLTGLYLHFNGLSGEIPKEIASLSELTDLYLNVNSLSGSIPSEIGNMSNLQVLQLCYNKLTGGIPTQLGNIKRLTVLSLQYNQLGGTIPASLGGLGMLTRLDLSFNSIFGPVPVTLADAPMLELLDIRNNSFVGNVPPALKRLKGGFQYKNNPGLCGVGFSDLSLCTASRSFNPNRPEPYQPKLPGNLSSKDIPESADLLPNCNESLCPKPSKSSQTGLLFGVIGVVVAFSVTCIFLFSSYRRRKQKIGTSDNSTDNRLSTDQVKEVYRKSVSSLISLEYSNGWDPLAKGRRGSGFSQEIFENFVFNLEEVERATQCFSEANLLGRSNFSAVYKGIWRDGSIVAIKCMAKTNCNSDEAEFLKVLKILTSLKHENLVKFRGFCCSKGRGECFLIYDFVPNGSLLQYLDVRPESGKVLEWSDRVSIIHGIAKGMTYLHEKNGKRPALVHQNISAEKVLMDSKYNPVLSDSGLYKLLTDDTVFSMVKAAAAMGYLAPEYATTGRFTEKSDMYAFGMIMLQVISGKRNITQLARLGAESGKFENFIDSNLEGEFLEAEAAKLGRLALLCTHESSDHRPSIENVIQELGG